jgi:serine/threonine-protein kinase
MSISLQWLGPRFPQLLNIAPLNAGGQKEVFSADHPIDGPVVLKIIRPQQDVESIRREILAVKQVGCPRYPCEASTFCCRRAAAQWTRGD